MKITSALAFSCFALMGLAPAAHAVEFNFGSTGSDGALVVNDFETKTVTLPPTGILNYTTVTLKMNSTLKFVNNAANTPVYMLTTGAVTIAAGAVIDVKGFTNSGRTGGAPGPGGWRGGDSLGNSLPESGGFGPGAGGPNAAGNSNYLQDPLMPLFGGSGSGSYCSQGGGGGGGAILIASNTSITLNGKIMANPGFNGCGQPGSGGAIRLLAPTVSGTGAMEGQVRSRIDAIFRDGINITGINTIDDLMVPFLPDEPTLDIVGLGNQSTPDLQDGVIWYVEFPIGDSSTKPITVHAEGFTGIVPISIRVTPASGSPTTTNGFLHMTTHAVPGGGAERDFDITFPTNMPSYVEVWTRPNDPQ